MRYIINSPVVGHCISYHSATPSHMYKLFWTIWVGREKRGREKTYLLAFNIFSNTCTCTVLQRNSPPKSNVQKKKKDSWQELPAAYGLFNWWLFLIPVAGNSSMGRGVISIILKQLYSIPFTDFWGHLFMHSSHKIPPQNLSGTEVWILTWPPSIHPLVCTVLLDDPILA